jgi:acetyl esterase/lipase
MTPRPLAAALLLIAGTFALSTRAAEPPADVQFARDVVYGKGGGEDLKLNIARPKGDAKNLPCLVFIHGGGWMGGDRTAHDDATWRMAQRGYVSATVGYRFAPKHKFPAQVNDVKCAIRYLRAHADEHGLDPKRIAVCGFSAGAHLAMMLGVTQKEDGLEGDGGWPEQSSGVQAVVSFFGPTDLAAPDLKGYTSPLLASFLGGPLRDMPDKYKHASPVTYVTAGDAPMLLVQGTKDPLVPPTQAYRMLDAMTKAGVTGRADVLAGAGHGWGGPELMRTLLEAVAFVDEQLKVPATAQSPAPAAPVAR